MEKNCKFEIGFEYKYDLLALYKHGQNDNDISVSLRDERNIMLPWH